MITNLVPALGWTLLHSLWQGALLFLIAAPLLAALRNKSPQLRYSVACVALLLLLGSMVWTFTSQVDLTQTNPTQTAGILMITEPAAGQELPTMDAATVGEAPSVAASTTSSLTLAHFLESNVVYLVALWGLGVLVFTVRWCSMLLVTFRMRKRGARKLSQEWQDRLLHLRRKMGIDQAIGLVESNQVDTPLVIGYFKPIILLPIGLVNGLSVAQVEAILAHELAHVGRRDFLVNLILTSLEVVLFYHPVYWWFMARINEEREKCCDDAAVAACGNPRMYARTLLSVEEHRQSGMLALGFAKAGGQLQNRIKRICKVAPRQHHTASLRFWLVLPLLLGAVAITYAGVSPNRVNVPTPQQEELTDHAIITLQTNSKDAELALSEPIATAKQSGNEALIQEAPLAVTTVSAVDEAPAVVAAPGQPPIEVNATSPLIAEAADSLPKPAVPSLRENPVLPSPPAFDLSAQEINGLLGNEASGRKELRDATNAYRDQINNWNDEVKEQYLKAWETHRENIVQSYDDWNQKLKAASDSELEYALEHERMVPMFERAFEQHEDAIEEAEDAIEHRPEFDVEVLENAIERGEKSIKEHSERMEVHSIRMGMHSVRMQIHSGRMRLHSGRMQMHTARMKLHTKRMESHRVIMEALQAELRSELIADGYLKEGEEKFHFEMTNESIHFNGKKIGPESQEQKYRDILTRYGKGDISGSSANKFIIQIDKSGRKIGVEHKKN